MPSVEDSQWNLLYAVGTPVLSPLFLLFSVRDVLAVDYTVFRLGPIPVRTRNPEPGTGNIEYRVSSITGELKAGPSGGMHAALEIGYDL